MEGNRTVQCCAVSAKDCAFRFFAEGGVQITYDLHVHSCLSPCAEEEMLPADIVGFAKLNGIELLAITDHNTAENLPAAENACKYYGVRLLPGIEVTSAEEIHLLTYFPSVKAALDMGRILSAALPAVPFNASLWGRQVAVDQKGNKRERTDKLLSCAVSLDLYQIKTACESLGGIAVPAHVNRNSCSLLSVLGFAPEDLPFEAYEVERPAHTLSQLWAEGRLPKGCAVLTSSDAHRLLDIAFLPQVLPADHPLRRLL